MPAPSAPTSPDRGERPFDSGAIADALVASRNPDGGYGYYPNKRSRVEPTAWVALSPSVDAGRALGWLTDAQGADGWVRDDRRAPINYGMNALALLAFLTDSRTRPQAERLGQALLQVKGLAYGPSPVVRQDNSLQAWPWVDNTLSWVEPTAYALLATKKARAAGLLERSAKTAAVRIGVAEQLLEDRACVSGGWNYGNSQVFGANLYAHGPTTALALLALQDRASTPFVSAGVRFLEAHADSERSGFALSLAALTLRLYRRPTDHLTASMQQQAPTSLAVANTVTLAGLSLTFSEDAGALRPFSLES